jgi:hypothetical protein
MARRLLFFGLALAVLTLTSAASATLQAVTGKMTVVGDKGDYRLVIENDASSTGNITCWLWELGQGALVTAASRVDGWQLGLSRMAPAPIIGGRVAPPGTGIPPGGRAEFRILTDKTFDPNGSPGRGAISEDCKTDSSVVMTFGTPPKPIPKPPPSACNCTNLSVTGSKYSSSQVNTGDAQLKLSLNWTMSCTGASGRPCAGRIELTAPKGSDIEIVAPTRGNVQCKGRCRLGPSTHKGTTVMRATSAGNLYFDARAGKSFVFRLKLYCTRGGKEVLVGAKRMTFAFAGSGFLDKRKSDLNGNGVADGKEK